MLKELSIKNFAIIDDLRIEFTEGLNLLTGETGSGKSIIIEALGILLGGRGNKDLIRTGEDKAVLEAVFYIDDYTKSILEDYGIDAEDGVLIVSREIPLNYPSITRVNSRTIPLNVLNNITSNLVDIFGQHEHQSLLNVSNHQILIDSFGDNVHKTMLKTLKKDYDKYQELKKELENMNKSSQEREREIDLLKFQIDEIDDAKLTDEDDYEVENEYKKLININEITMNMGGLIDTLAESDYNSESVLSLLSKSINLLSNISEFDNSLGDFLKRLNEVRYELQDISLELKDYLDGLELDDEKFNYYSERFDLINKLKKKYGNNVEKILKYRDEIEIEYTNLINYEKKIKNLKSEIDNIMDKLVEASNKISKNRKLIALDLENKISKELAQLNMGKIIFKVSFKEKNQISSSGLDDIEFMIATNPGESLKPLSKIVSGGEMSRIMLAFKSIIADNDQIPTLIFDEIDTGISGRTAQIVGEKICKISKNHQVISISHLPQIVALADSHYQIRKDITDDKTITKVERLVYEDRVKELARLLGGVNLTELTLNHAKEMLEMSKKIKI